MNLVPVKLAVVAAIAEMWLDVCQDGRKGVLDPEMLAAIEALIDKTEEVRAALIDKADERLPAVKDGEAEQHLTIAEKRELWLMTESNYFKKVTWIREPDWEAIAEWMPWRNSDRNQGQMKSWKRIVKSHASEASNVGFVRI